MSSKAGRGGARLFGHPLHPMLVGFPLAFWFGANVWDLASFLAPGPPWAQLAYWTLLLGLGMAVPAMATGLWELIAFAGTPAVERRIWWHMGVMSVAFCFFLVSLLLRRGALDQPTVPLAAAIIGAIGMATALAGGWLGGELVFVDGVGVRAKEPA